MEKYPLPLTTGADCRILYGFGDKICQMIDQKLNVNQTTKTIYKMASTSDIDSRKRPNPADSLNDPDDDQNQLDPPVAKQVKRTMAPKTIIKTNSAGPKLFNNPTNSLNAPTTISALLGIVQSSSNKTDLQTADIVQVFHPGTFQIILCIDNAEASRSTQKVLLEHLKKNSIDYDVRKLNIGDFLWMVRCK